MIFIVNDQRFGALTAKSSALAPRRPSFVATMEQAGVRRYDNVIIAHCRHVVDTFYVAIAGDRSYFVEIAVVFLDASVAIAAPQFSANDAHNDGGVTSFARVNLVHFAPALVNEFQ